MRKTVIKVLFIYGLVLWLNNCLDYYSTDHGFDPHIEQRFLFLQIVDPVVCF